MTVNSTGTLLLGNSEQIATATTVTLNGGKLQTAGFDETVGALTLNASSIIDLGSGDSVLKFADSHTIGWTGTLSIYNWTGSLSGGGTDEVFFGSASSGLSVSQLAQVSFFSGNGSGPLGSARILGSGEIVPVPEPAVIWSGLALVGLIGFQQRRRLRKFLSGRS